MDIFQVWVLSGNTQGNQHPGQVLGSSDRPPARLRHQMPLGSWAGLGPLKEIGSHILKVPSLTVRVMVQICF